MPRSWVAGRKPACLASLLLALLLGITGCRGPASAPSPPSATQPEPLPTVLQASGPATALVGGTLIDGTGAAPVPDAVVVIRGRQIAAAGPRASVDVPEGARVFDVRGDTILPGFINAHVHGGFDQAALEAWAQEGVTTVRDLAVSTLSPDFAFRDRIRSQPHCARLVAAGPMITVPGGYPIARWGGTALTVVSADDAARTAEALLNDGADLIKIPLESGAIFGQDMPMLSEDEAQAVVRVAHGRGRRVSVHVTVAADLPRALAAGVDDIAHMATDCVPDEVIERMVQDGVYWVPTLELWRGVGLHSPATNDNLRRFCAAGGKVALGTDYLGAPGVEFDLGMPMTEIELMAEAGMTPMQIIVAGTLHAATVCGLDEELGTLEPGKVADVLVVFGDPIGDLHALEDTRLVLRDGVVIRESSAP